MKKILTLILVLCLSFTFAASAMTINAYAYEAAVGVGNGEGIGVGAGEGVGGGDVGGGNAGTYVDTSFQISSHVIMNQATDCYDIDIYAVSEAKYLSNFESIIMLRYNGTLSDIKVSAESYVKGNIAAGVKTDERVDSEPFLKVVFNGTKNIDLTDSEFCIPSSYNILRVATIRTNIKIYKDFEKGTFDAGLYAVTGTKNAGYMDGKNVVEYSCGNITPDMIMGDFDFDGEFTVKDMIAAQYYVVNGMEFVGDDKYNLTFNEISEVLLSSSSFLQCLQMYVCGKTSFGEYYLGVMKLIKGGGPSSGGGGSTGATKFIPPFTINRPQVSEYWDYDYWGTVQTEPDEQGFVCYGEDEYGNYHFWNTETGEKFMSYVTDYEYNGGHGVKNGTCTVTCEYTIEGGKITLIKGGEHVKDWDVSFYAAYPFIAEYWNEEYWASKTKHQEGDIVYMGYDENGRYHIWNMATGEKYFELDDIRYNYVLSPVDNRIIFTESTSIAHNIKRALWITRDEYEVKYFLDKE